LTRALVVLAAFAVAVPVALAGSRAQPGVTSSTITIGGTVPISGPAALFGSVGRGADAYFKYVNAHGGVNGRKIKYLYLDDAYDPSRTVQLTRQLVEQDHVFAIFNTVGTDNNLAIRDYLNAGKVPQLFGGTGTAKIGDDAKGHPWTMGYLPSFRAEGAIYGHSIASVKNAKVAVLYEDSDFGKDMTNGLKKGLGAALSRFDEYQLAKYRKTRAEITLVTAQLERQYPKENKNVGGAVVGLRDELSRQSRMLPTRARTVARWSRACTGAFRAR